MGYYVSYVLDLTISKANIAKAIEIFNYLHTDDMLEKYARGGSSLKTGNIRDYKWYSWVNNPETPYKTLEEAFKNWCIVEDDIKMEYNEAGDFEISGKYNNKLGQQDFLIEKLAPVLEDTCIKAEGEDGAIIIWGIFNYKFLPSYIEAEDKDSSAEESSSEDE